jgi:hypothetical protein
VCCAFSFCWWACAECEDVGSPPVVVLKDARYSSSSSIAATEPDGGKRQAVRESPLSWPRALRKIRSWLQPYVMLLRYWRAYTELPPPKEFQALGGRVFSAEGLYLYVH